MTAGREAPCCAIEPRVNDVCKLAFYGTVGRMFHSLFNSAALFGQKKKKGSICRIKQSEDK